MNNHIPILIDNPESLDYEYDKSFFLLRLIIMWLLTIWVAIKKRIFGIKLKTNSFWFDGTCFHCKKLKESVFTWRALNIIYNFSALEKDTFEAKLTNFWNKMKNAQAVRNRLKMVEFYLKQAIEKQLLTRGEIRLLSIASGSAYGVMKVIASLKKANQGGVKIHAVLLDLDPTAIEYSKKLAKKAGVIEQLSFVNKSTTFLEEVTKDFRPHVIEMVGFLEYRPYDKAIQLLQKIHHILAPDGILITSQIAPNTERIFLSIVVNWPMVYRTPTQFSEVITKAKFDTQKCKIIYEPFKIHGLAICKK